MRNWLTALLICAGLLAVPPARGEESQLVAVDHAKWSALLAEYVDKESRVDYRRLADESIEQLDAYLDEIARAKTARLDPQQFKALFINAYNALTVRWVLRHYPVPSIWSTPNPFKDVRHTVGGERWSLDQIESKVREAGDPRIHAALVCAARSCPPLRREAFTAESMDEQLDDNSRRWLADRELNRFERAKGQVQISPIFNWYREDFRAFPGGLEGFLKRHAPEEIRQAFSDGRPKIRFLDYHWGLNDQSELGENYSGVRLGFDWFRNIFR